MAYSSQLYWNGSTGRGDADTGWEYIADWRVITDDALDQAEKVQTWFRANHVDYGDPYLYANDDDSGSVVKQIDVVRDKKSTDVWIVTVTYRPPDSGELSYNFIPGRLPLRCIDVTFSTVQKQKPVEDALYRGGFVGTAATIISDGDKTIPINSAFVPFDPGLEKDVANVTMRVVRRWPWVDVGSMSAAMNVVNSSAFTISHCGATYNVLAYQAKIRSASAQVKLEDNQYFWEIVVVVDFAESWHDEIADRGTIARAAIGDSDGRGGTVAGNDIIAGVPSVRELVDLDETPISDPVLFDGDGGPLDVSTSVVPVYIRYSKYPEVDFRIYEFFTDYGLIV